jgi:hypothetical protein
MYSFFGALRSGTTVEKLFSGENPAGKLGDPSGLEDYSPIEFKFDRMLTRLKHVKPRRKISHQGGPRPLEQEQMGQKNKLPWKIAASYPLVPATKRRS